MNERTPAPCTGRNRPTRTPSLINRKAVKTFALAFCKTDRPKFHRVSSEFLADVEAQLDSRIRQLAVYDSDIEAKLVTTFAARKAQQRLNLAAKAIIVGKIRAHPSIGVTLK